MVAHVNSLQIKLLLYKLLPALETSLLLVLSLIKRKQGLSVPEEISVLSVIPVWWGAFPAIPDPGANRDCVGAASPRLLFDGELPKNPLKLFSAQIYDFK